MIDVLGFQLDTWDTAILAAIALATLYYLYTTYVRRPAEHDYRSFGGIVPVSSPLANTSAGGGNDESGFIQKMKNGGRSVAIFYGSQTGTAEELAGRLAKDAKRYGLKAIVLDPEECSMVGIRLSARTKENYRKI